MTNCEKISSAVRPYAGQTLVAGKVISLVLSMYPGTNPTSVIPSDHSGPNPRSGRSYCSCSCTGRQVFSRSGNGYVVRGANEQIEIRNVAASSRNPVVSWKNDRPTQFVGSADQASLVEALRRLKSSIRRSSDRAWQRDAALRVIDCVLSLNRNYDSFVVPRLDRFERRHPSIRTIADLQRLMASYPSALVFVARCLDYNDDARSVTLSRVVDWLIKVADSEDYDTQMLNLKRWAANAKPEDHFKPGIAGFGLGGFQYLRMLFGANTTKPDVHIQRYVASCVGHRVSDVQALALLEAAAAKADVSLRDLDTTIWEKSARGA
jgi:hypothetical protein